MITATYTNGFQDTYKGKRDVKAAWAIFDLNTDKVIASGHSLTTKAATSNANSSKHLPHFDIKWVKEVGIKRGYHTKEELAQYIKENQDAKSNRRIEIIEL